MAPVAAAVLVEIAASAVLSVLAGAVIGALVWRLRWGLVFGAAGVVAFLLVAPALFHVRAIAFASLNAPPMIMVFLFCDVMARHLAIRRHWKWVGATLVAFVCALVLGALYIKLFGAVWHVSRWGPAWLAVVVDVGLAVLAIRSRTVVKR